MYVIRRNEDGKFVARPGAANSYTKSIREARKFNTRAEAQADCCGNEYVVAVSDLM